MMKIRFTTTSSITMIISSCLLLSCASERTITKSKLEVDAFGNPVNYTVGKDEDGNPMMKSDVRSFYEGDVSNIASQRGKYNGKDYARKSYRTERWGGDSDYKIKQFGGSQAARGYDQEPWFVKKQASAQGKTAQVGKESFFTKMFGTSDARENRVSDLKKESDAETNVRRRVFIQPDVISYKEQAELNVSETNQLLGR
ncbi:MAG: hypothetical protein ACSHX0_05620 [Akkermansiaceae bacterium]